MKAGGFVYVIEFSHGVVKVGRSQNPKSRLSSHRGTAKRFGVQVVNSWTSPPHEDWVENETELKRIAGNLGGEVDGEEYFSGVAFDDVVREARALSFEPLTEEVIRERWERRFLNALFPCVPDRMPLAGRLMRVAPMTGPELDQAASAIYERLVREGADEWDRREWNAIVNFHDLIRPLMRDGMTVFEAAELYVADKAA